METYCRCVGQALISPITSVSLRSDARKLACTCGFTQVSLSFIPVTHVVDKDI